MHFVVCGWDEGFLRRLLARGATVSLVAEAMECPADAAEALGITEVLTVADFDSLAELSAVAEPLARRGPRPDRVLGLTEAAQFGAGYLAALLGFGDAQLRHSQLVRDKRAMKEAVRAAGVPVARQSTVDRTAGVDGAVESIAHGVGLPAVLKPVSGTGTRDTALVRDRAEARAFLARVPSTTRLMAEEVLTGVELHVDAVWLDGRPVVFGVSRYAVPRIEVTDPGRLNGSAVLGREDHREPHDRLIALNHQVNQAIGAGDTITHMEVFVADSGEIVFSEIATRPPGGGINLMFEAAAADLRGAWAQVLTDPAGLHGEPTVFPRPYVGWVNIAPSAPGQVVSLPAPEDLARHPHIVRVLCPTGIGDVITDLTSTSWTMLVFFTASSWEQYRSRADGLERDLRIRTVSLPDRTPAVASS